MFGGRIVACDSRCCSIGKGERAFCPRVCVRCGHGRLLYSCTRSGTDARRTASKIEQNWQLPEGWFKLAPCP